jgi:hypothetical protein
MEEMEAPKFLTGVSITCKFSTVGTGARGKQFSIRGEPDMHEFLARTERFSHRLAGLCVP